MIISTERPPIWDELHKHFPGIDDKNTIYTYGDTLYNPGKLKLNQPLLEHEALHARQQALYPGGPRAWWDRYFVDVEFRMNQELAAYTRQYGEFCLDHMNRDVRARYLYEMAGIIAGETYGNVISRAAAQKTILGKR